ncbi:MAG: hypothetical protein WCI63_02815 [bacterium]
MTFPIPTQNNHEKQERLIETSRKNYAITYVKPTQKTEPVGGNKGVEKLAESRKKKVLI